MSANVDIVIEELTKQVAELSKEKAIYVALATRRTQEVNELRKENEELKKKIEELEKQEKPEK